jgi:tagatose 6-phosphate kinase
VIVCICLSPAIDITYHVSRVRGGATNRVDTVGRRPGGKAVNVARILHALGEDVALLAPAGGHPGAEFAEDLAALGVPADLVPNAAATRSTVTIVDESGDATLFVEPAPLDCWPALLDRAESAVADADVVVVSGAVPTGAPPDAIGALVRLVRGAGRPSVVDTSGPALLDALAAGPTIVKPNADELASVSGDADPLRAAAALAAEYRTTVVASLGADGVVVAEGGPAGISHWRARPARAVTGNPTGAGDALVAGLARGLRFGIPMPELLRDAVALSAAAVARPYAGEVDLASYANFRDAVLVEPAGVSS